MRISRIFRVGAIAVAASAVAVGVGQAQSARHARTTQIPKTFVLPGDALFPEGMGYDPSKGDFFVGAIGGGAVLRGNVNDPNVEGLLAGGRRRAERRPRRTTRPPARVRWELREWQGLDLQREQRQADRDSRHGHAELGPERLLVPARRNGVRDRLHQPVPLAHQVRARRQADARQVPRLHRHAVRLYSPGSTRTGS